jgi:uncharacterized protein (TIGR02118 family)
MIRLSVMYPAKDGSEFNWEYYLGPHLDLAHRLLDVRGLLKIEIDRGIGSLPPGTPAPYHAVGHLFFPSIEVMIGALTDTAPQFIADEPNYCSAGSVVQISEVVA